jgi:hypothetical protein
MTKRKRYEDDDDDNVLRTLKDGERIHFSMMTMDSEVLPARDALSDSSPMMVVDAFGNSGLALNKPGARYLTAGTRTTDHAALVMRDHLRREARDEYITELCDAWKSTNDREVARVHDTGDAVRDSYLDQVHDLTTAWSRGRR